MSMFQDQVINSVMKLFYLLGFVLQSPKALVNTAVLRMCKRNPIKLDYSAAYLALRYDV